MVHSDRPNRSYLNPPKIFHSSLNLCVRFVRQKDLLTTCFLTHARRVCFGTPDEIVEDITPDGSWKILVFFTGFSRNAYKRGSENVKLRGSDTSKANQTRTVIQSHVVVRTVWNLSKMNPSHPGKSEKLQYQIKSRKKWWDGRKKEKRLPLDRTSSTPHTE